MCIISIHSNKTFWVCILDEKQSIVIATFYDSYATTIKVKKINIKVQILIIQRFLIMLDIIDCILNGTHCGPHA